MTRVEITECGRTIAGVIKPAYAELRAEG